MKRQKLYISIAVMCAVLLLGGAGGSAAWGHDGGGEKVYHIIREIREVQVEKDKKEVVLFR